MTKVISMRRDPEGQPPIAPQSRSSSQGGRPGLPVMPVVEEYLRATKGHLAAQVWKDYRYILKVFAAWADAQKVGLEYINRRVIDQFCEHLEATHQNAHNTGPVSKRRQANYVRVIKAFLYSTKADSIIYGEYLSADTIRAIDLPAYDETLIVAFSDSDIKELLKACLAEKTEVQRVRNQTIIYLLANTGIRALECTGLSISDLCLEPDMGSVKVMGKGRRERIVHFGELTRRKLVRYLEVCRKDATPDAPLFVSYSLTGRGVRGLTTSGLSQLIETIGKRTSITGVRISPHTFRHHYACEAIRRGVSIYDLKVCLGHKSVEMTERYCRSLASTDYSFRERIAGLLR
jgi:site-specific recombinase XerD